MTTIDRYLAITNEYTWAKGNSENEALENARYNKTNPLMKAEVFFYTTENSPDDWSDGISVGGMGEGVFDSTIHDFPPLKIASWKGDSRKIEGH